MKAKNIIEHKPLTAQIAVQSNALINARYEMTAFQKKIILYLISKIQVEDTAFKTYKIEVKDFITLADYDSKNIYSPLKYYYSYHGFIWC